MGLQRNEDENEHKTIYPFSREFLHRQAELIKQKSRKESTSQIQESEETEVQPTQIPELENIESWATKLAQQTAETTEDSKRDERFLLMATATIKMCRLLKNFSQVMTEEMEQIKASSLQNLNLQSQYAKDIKISTDKAVHDIYQQFKDEQTQAFKEISHFMEQSADDMEREIFACTAEVKKATVVAEKAVKTVAEKTMKLQKVRSVRDLLLLATPVIVLIDIILRAIATVL